MAYIDRDGGAYERRVIQLCRRGDQQVEVLSGRAEGDRVVTNGNLLIDGQAEMNRSFMVGTGPAKEDAPAEMKLDESQAKAVAEFLKVAVLYAHPEEVAEALYMAGQILETTGDGERAIEQYREILENYPEARFARPARERLRDLEP